MKHNNNNIKSGNHELDYDRRPERVAGIRCKLNISCLKLLIYKIAGALSTVNK